MELVGSTKSKITKDNNGQNVPHVEVTEIVLVHCIIVNNNYQQNSNPCIHLFLIYRYTLKTFDSEFSYIE